MIISAPGNTTCGDTLKITLINSTGTVTPIVVTHTVCNMDTLALLGLSNGTNSWSGTGLTAGSITSATLQVLPSFTNTANGFYTYTDSMRTTSGNCLSILKYSIKIKSFKGNITVTEPIKCYNYSNGIILAKVSEPNGPINNPDKYTFTWAPANLISSSNPTAGTGATASGSIQNLRAGTYTCEIRNGNCINDVIYKLADGVPLPTDSIYAYYCPKDSLALLVAKSGNTNYQWHPNNIGASTGGDSIKVTVPNIHNYYVSYTSKGCPDTAKLIIPVTTYDAFRPNELVNVFSPNGDKINDFFYPFFESNFNQYQIYKQSDTYELSVYDRWGKSVYETTDYSKPWDGKTKSGHNADDGTYFYVVKYKSNCGSNADLEEKKGFVELVR